MLPGAPSPGELWRSRQWRRLLNYVDQLPSHSRTYAALVQDEEYAALVLEAQEEAEKAGRVLAGGPSMTTWTPEVAALAMVNDKLAVLIEAKKKKPGRITPYARPSTAFQRVKQRKRLQTHERLVAAVLPHKQAGE
jgi:hypothetical protein